MAFFLKRIIKQPAMVIAGAITLLVVVIYFFPFDFLKIVDLKTIDLQFKARGEKAPGERVVMAVIDEKSIDREGRWIWPRSKIATLVNKLSDAGVRVIAFDIGFQEPDDRRVIHAINRIQDAAKELGMENGVFHDYIVTLRESSDNDRLLAEAIRQSKAKVVLGWFFHVAEDVKNLSHLDPEERRKKEGSIQSARYLYTRSSGGAAEPDLKLLDEIAPEPVIPILSEAAGFSGYFNFRPDGDGINRWLEAVLRYNDNLYAPLSLVALSAYYDSPLYLEVGPNGEVLNSCIGDQVCIPTDFKGRIMINYRGSDHLFPYISITDILHDRVSREQLADKIVVVGATAIGTFDLVVNPFSATFPGPEIHANVIDSVLARDFLHRPEYFQAVELLAIVLCGLFLGAVLSRAGVIAGAAAAMSMAVGYSLLCLLLFSTAGVVLSMVYPLLAIVLVYIGVTAYKYFVEEGQKRFIRNAFSTYLAPTVVKQLIESPDKLVLGGEQRDITAFFSDVQGFTSISEKLTPTELVELLNHFLTEMTDIILKHEGTVDKFEGDAIIAFFGAPNFLENHAETAVRACLEMQTRLAHLREMWREQGRPELNMRIGLCSGSAVVGNMGSRNRMDYTMMGDTVNTAARLEGVNKVYGIYTLMGETTCALCSEQIVVREIDSINVVGKQEPVTVYEPLGFKGQVSEESIRMSDLYAKGLAAYRGREWEKAAAFFEKALAVAPGDGPSRTMIQRCRLYRQTPPAEGWNGAYTMESK